MQKIIFIHIPKAAGTSFKAMVDKNYDKEKIFPYSDLSQFDVKDIPKYLEQYDVFMGHFNYQIFPKYAKKDMGFKMITFLRDPIERVYSEYHYYQRFTREHAEKVGDIAKIVKDCGSLESYINSAEFPAMFRNTNLQAKYYVEKILGDANYAGDVDLLNKAKIALDEMDFVGTAEMFEASTDLIEKKFSLNLGKLDKKLNSTSEAVFGSILDITYDPDFKDMEVIEMETLTEKLRKKIFDMNQVDYQLHQYALKKLNKEYQNLQS